MTAAHTWFRRPHHRRDRRLRPRPRRQAAGERTSTAVLADLDSERNRQVAADLGCPFVVLDVTDRAANEAVVAQIEAEHGRLDAAYLNAGISAAKSDDALDLDEFMRVVDDRPVRRRLRRRRPRGRRSSGPAGERSS